MSAGTLSRREEEQLLKSTKAYALKACDDLVKDFAECVEGRTLSVAWACKGKYKLIQDCMYQYTRPDSMQLVRDEYVKVRTREVAANRPT